MPGSSRYTLNFPGYGDLGFNFVVNLDGLRRIRSIDVSDGDVTIVEGYAENGDGSGGLYSYVASSVVADNDGGQIKPNDLDPSQPGRWQLISMSGIATNQIPMDVVALSTITTPAAGKQKLFIDEADGYLKRMDSTGAVKIVDVGLESNSIQSASINASGDLVVIRPDGLAIDCGKVVASVSIGSVSTGAPGSVATVTNTGTAGEAVLNFTIPRGDTGAVGPQGIQGLQGNTGLAATVAVGSVSTGAPGSQATISNSGSSSNAIFNFTLPQGATGQTGLTGATGPGATVAIGTVSGGDTAAVTNSGTSTAAVLNFTLPKGDKGDTGTTGAVGPAGPAMTDATTLGGQPSSYFYPASNPSGFLTSIASAQVTSALGFTPANKAGDTFSGAVAMSSALSVSGATTLSGGASVTGQVAASDTVQTGGDFLLNRTSNPNGYLLRPNTAGYKNLAFAVSGGGPLDTITMNSASTSATGNLSVTGNLTANGSTHNLAGTLTIGGGLTSGDIVTQRSATSGAIYLGSNKASYIYNDGTNFNFTNPSLFNSNVTIAGTATHNGVANFNGVLNTGAQVNFGSTVNMLGGNSYQWYTGNAGTDNKYWRSYADANGTWWLQTVNDAYSASSNAMYFTRNGNGTVHGYFNSDITVQGCTGVIGQFQAVGGGGSTWYNTGWRNDGSTLYLMKSAAQSSQAAAQASGWDGTRPFMVNLSSGQVQIDATGASTTIVGGGLQVNNTITANNGVNIGGVINQSGTTNLNGQNNLNGNTVSNAFTANGVISALANNGGRNSIRCGDDCSLGDANIQHTLSVTSQSDGNQGFIVFGQSSTKLGMSANDGYLRWGGDFIADSWIRTSGGGGFYFNAYGRGIVAPDAGGASYGNVSNYGGGLNGWCGFAAYNSDIIMMSNGQGRGLWSSCIGNWLANFDSSGNVVFPANVTAYSDERLKQNIRPIENPWSIINGMTGIRYERDGESRVGLGAQTTRKVLPEVVFEADDLTGTLSVNYGDCVGPIIEALKDAYRRIAILENR